MRRFLQNLTEWFLMKKFKYFKGRLEAYGLTTSQGYCSLCSSNQQKSMQNLLRKWIFACGTRDFLAKTLAEHHRLDGVQKY